SGHGGDGEEPGEERAHRATLLGLGLAGALLAACADPVSELSEVYYRGPGAKVLCAVGVDHNRSDDDGIALGLDRARDDGLVVQLYAHVPGRTVSVERIERILAGARDRGLTYFTYDDFADGAAASAGLALSFDDAGIDEWWTIADLLDRYDARVTFFIAYYDGFTPAQRDLLRALAARGHAVAAHSVSHLRAPDYADRHGLEGYMRDEVRPGVESLRRDGHDPRVFAYPYGARTSELDRTILAELALVRSVTFSRDSLVVVDPCPE
ncbi:MAG: polysaccharide deacetylase family protein, partial [Deltaproteobacteria bacterium]|nr:polysaccharide deacetylase family protein [Kofleriaceae bacterium]